MLLILLLLVGQAYCDLSLPSYTSDILNIGLQQNGIKDAVMDSVRDDTLKQLELFMSDGDAAIVESAYCAPDSDGVRTLSESCEREELNGLLLTPECVILGLQNMPGDISLENIQMAVESGFMTRDQLLSQMHDALSQMDNLTDTYKVQMAVQFVKAEYEAHGVDVDAIRSAYLRVTGAKMLAMSVAMMAIAVLVGLLSSVTSAKIGRGLRRKIFEKVTAFTGEEMERFSTASLITRSTNDIQQIQMVSVMLLRMVAYAPILAIGGIIKVVHTNTGMGWIIVLAVGILMFTIVVLGSIAMPKFKIMQKLVDRVNLVSREILTGVMPIRAFSRESHEEARFDGANTDLLRTQLFTNRVMTFLFPIMMFVMNGVSVLIVWVGSKGVDNGTMQIGDLTAFITYSMVIVMGFLIMSMVSIILPRAAVAADRIMEVINTDLVLSDPAEPRDSELDNVKGELKFDHVCFRYPGADEDSLSDLCFTARPGETTAIIGSTGCGKTTLLNLIPRFFDVTAGSITMDGIDIREISQHKLRSLLGYVPQKGVLFSGTIESNLKYGGDEITDDDIRKAASIAQAEEFISSRPDGFDAPIAQGGSNVSGGQKQRLSIARAIAKHPKVYLFDDSFSALDYRTDLALRKALAETTKDATVIIVAQRISTILHADNILVLDDGKIVGSGTHEELLHSCTTYQEIAKSQLSDKELGLEGGAD